MFGIGGFELVLILLFAFLIFGPDKLPEVVQTANKALQKFRKAQQEVDSVIKNEMIDEDARRSNNPLDMIDSAAKKIEKSEESFADRKARYDQERAEQISKPAPTSMAQEEAEQEEEEPRPAPVKANRTAGVIPSADELYGVKPSVKPRKPAPKSESQVEEG